MVIVRPTCSLLALIAIVLGVAAADGTHLLRPLSFTFPAAAEPSFRRRRRRPASSSPLSSFLHDASLPSGRARGGGANVGPLSLVASSAAVPASSQSQSSAAAPTKEYDGLTLVQLRDICRERGLPVSGTKAAVLGRIREDDDDAMRVPVSGDSPHDSKASDESSASDAESARGAVGIGAESEDYGQLTVASLKDILRERGLPVSGAKSVLIRRLFEYDKENTDAPIPAHVHADACHEDERGSLDKTLGGRVPVEGGYSEEASPAALIARVLGDASNDPLDPSPSHQSPPQSQSQSNDKNRTESRRLWFMARRAEELVRANDPRAVPAAEEFIDAMTERYRNTDGDLRSLPLEPVKAYTLLVNAHAKSGLPDAARRAEGVLREMQRSHDDGGGGGGGGGDGPVRPKPNVYTYTAVIDAYARSPDLCAAQRAETLLYEMLDRAKEGDEAVQPSFKTGDAVLNAWARRGTVEGAEKASQLLERIGKLEAQRQKQGAALTTEDGDMGGMRLTTSSFATVISGWSRSGANGSISAANAEALLKNLIRLWEEKGQEEEWRKGELQPNTFIFNAVIDAWGKSKDQQAGTRAEKLIVQMLELADNNQELDVEPDEFSFNSCINSHAISGHKNAAKLAEGVLKMMQDRGKVPPNTISYNSVLNAWSKSKFPGAADRSEQILLSMLTAYISGNKLLKPTVFSFSSVLNARAKTKEPGKARRTEAILHRLAEVYEKMGRADEDLKPNAFCYNGVLNAAAFSADFDEKEKRDALQVAVATFNEMKRAGCQPDSVTYGNMLKCFANLMPTGDNRNRMSAQMFENCCEDGQVGEMVLNEIQRAVPRNIFLSLIGGKARRKGTKLSCYDLPRKWTCNVNERGAYLGKIKPTRKALKKRVRFRKNRKRKIDKEDTARPVHPVASFLVEGSWDTMHDV